MRLPLSDWNLFVADLIMVLLTGAVLILADRYYIFNQILLALLPIRTAVVFLMFRRLMRPVPRWGLIIALLSFELVLGFTNFFAGFREPLIMLTLCTIEVFDYRRGSHWVRIAALGGLIIATGLLWTEIKSDFRSRWTSDEFANSQSQRLQALNEDVSNWRQRSTGDPWAGADAFVDRIWTIRYPALALRRVPSAVPHANGALLSAVIMNLLQPRILFPDKPDMPSDSLKVREYAGVWVAGPEQNTSIAFGYVAESYVDFGIPLMFMPIFLCGTLWGALLQWLRNKFHHEELSIGATVLLGWSILYLFERSWLMLLGFGLTMFLTVGGLALAADRLIPILLRKRSLLRGSAPRSLNAA
jgi:hypothetical protein